MSTEPTPPDRAAGPVRFATLGPAGTNHEYVTRKYIGFHGLADAKLLLCRTVDEALDSVRTKGSDFFVICAVHPDTARAVGRCYRRIFVVDTFISPSLPLAILTRTEVARPRSVGVLHPSTTDYVDAAEWDRVEHVTTGTLHDVARAVLDGRCDSGLVYRHYADRYPDRLRIDREVGSPDDAWLVLGRQRTFAEPIQGWREAPVAGQFRQMEAGDVPD